MTAKSSKSRKAASPANKRPNDLKGDNLTITLSNETVEKVRYDINELMEAQKQLKGAVYMFARAAAARSSKEVDEFGKHVYEVIRIIDALMAKESDAAFNIGIRLGAIRWAKN